MIHIGVWLLVGGITGAVYRGRVKKKKAMLSHQSHSLDAEGEAGTEVVVVEADSVKTIDATFDDVGELKHYQKTSWYALAFTAAGSLFYAPATLLGLPLLGYNAYHFTQTLRNSTETQRRSAITVFEIIGVVGCLVTAKPFAASVVMLLAFGSRSLLLQAGNITNNLSAAQGLDFRRSSIWVIRDGVELEVAVAQLQSNDVVVFRAGDTIALEGKIVAGEGDIDQFSLKRKMKLLEKKVGDKVFPFTRISRGIIHVQPS